MTCTPCQQKSILTVGDAICHRIAGRGASIDCHGLAYKFIKKEITLHQYVEALEEKADDKEKEYLQEMRKTYG